MPDTSLLFRHWLNQEVLTWLAPFNLLHSKAFAQVIQVLPRLQIQQRGCEGLQRAEIPPGNNAAGIVCMLALSSNSQLALGPLQWPVLQNTAACRLLEEMLQHTMRPVSPTQSRPAACTCG